MLNLAVMVSPAHAGMDPWAIYGCGRPMRFPRTRGDGPHAPAQATPAPSFPPHTRGWTRDVGCQGGQVRVSPAHAGMDLPLDRMIHPWLSFPRTRGDGPADPTAAHGALLFPPHTRGWTPAREGGDIALAVSPAHAGMDR